MRRRDVDLQLAVGHAHHGVEVWVEVEKLRGAVKALHHGLEGVLLLERRGSSIIALVIIFSEVRSQ
jgi:hypothetical protein